MHQSEWFKWLKRVSDDSRNTLTTTVSDLKTSYFLFKRSLGNYLAFFRKSGAELCYKMGLMLGKLTGLFPSISVIHCGNTCCGYCKKKKKKKKKNYKFLAPVSYFISFSYILLISERWPRTTKSVFLLWTCFLVCVQLGAFQWKNLDSAM